MKKFFLKILKFICLINLYRSHLYFKKQFCSYLNRAGFVNAKRQGETEYKKKWKQISLFVESYSYRFFANYIGENPNIIPEAVLHNCIEPALNPREFIPICSDKNFFTQIIPKEFMPVTILRRMDGGVIMDENYNPIKFLRDFMDHIYNVSEIIIKPSRESSSGNGIQKFVRINQNFYRYNDSLELNEEFLLNYGSDFIVQECVEQSQFMSRLCFSSVNTIRIVTYRSYKTEEIILLCAVLRVGSLGSVVDNVHAGGRFVRIDLNTGALGNVLVNQYGDKQSVWNNVDYNSEKLHIPNWENVCSFAKSVAKCLRHQRLVSLDIAISKSNKPILIEYNIRTSSPWLFMLTNQLFLGDYTDEIIDYCKKKDLY